MIPAAVEKAFDDGVPTPAARDGLDGRGGTGKVRNSNHLANSRARRRSGSCASAASPTSWPGGTKSIRGIRGLQRTPRAGARGQAGRPAGGWPQVAGADGDFTLIVTPFPTISPAPSAPTARPRPRSGAIKPSTFKSRCGKRSGEPSRTAWSGRCRRAPRHPTDPAQHPPGRGSGRPEAGGAKPGCLQPGGGRHADRGHRSIATTPTLSRELARNWARRPAARTILGIRLDGADGKPWTTTLDPALRAIYVRTSCETSAFTQEDLDRR
ncbi:hypothetical protein ACRAWD_21865 [Caulobacter segnis]